MSQAGSIIKHKMRVTARALHNYKGFYSLQKLYICTNLIFMTKGRYKPLLQNIKASYSFHLKRNLCKTRLGSGKDKTISSDYHMFSLLKPELKQKTKPPAVLLDLVIIQI